MCESADRATLLDETFVQTVLHARACSLIKLSFILFIYSTDDNAFAQMSGYRLLSSPLSSDGIFMRASTRRPRIIGREQITPVLTVEVVLLVRTRSPGGTVMPEDCYLELG